MAVYIVTGKLGAGKTLVSVGMAQEALSQGRRVATNVDLNVEHLTRWQNRSATIYRLPDKLQAESFEQIGIGNESYEEEKNGLIILDEGGLSMNSRDYREKGRKEFIRWAIHSRKKGWDIAIIIQSIEGLDKQIREFFGEHVIVCMRFDRLKIPFIGWMLKLIGLNGNLPKMHLAVCKYGQGQSAVVAWRKWFKGKDLYRAYDTRQAYDPEDGAGVFQYLPAYYVKGRYSSRWDEIKANCEDFWNDYFNVKLGRLPVFFSAMILGGVVHAKLSGPDEPQVIEVPAPVQVSAEDQEKDDSLFSVDNLFSTDQGAEPPPLTPQEIWQRARIASYVSDPERGYLWYSFKDEYGEKLKVPTGWRVVAVSPCQAIVKSERFKVHIGCGK